MKYSPTRIAVVLLGIALCLVVGTSCRTVRGAGQDLEHVGRHIERAADR